MNTKTRGLDKAQGVVADHIAGDLTHEDLLGRIGDIARRTGWAAGELWNAAWAGVEPSYGTSSWQF